MEKHSKEYIDVKIKNCKELLASDISDAQRVIYQGYLDFWQGHDAEAVAEEKKRLAEEDKRLAEEEVKKLQEEEARKKAAEDLEKVIELVEISPEQEMKYAEEFEETNENKRAYRYSNGEKLQTNAFSEFITLKLKTQ